MTFAAVAQRITGVVTDSKTGEALPFANVSIEGGSYTRTNEAGRYALPFKAGKMRVSMIGYATKTLKVQQAGGYNVKLDDTLGQLNGRCDGAQDQVHAQKQPSR